MPWEETWRCRKEKQAPRVWPEARSQEWVRRLVIKPGMGQKEPEPYRPWEAGS